MCTWLEFWSPAYRKPWNSKKKMEKNISLWKKIKSSWMQTEWKFQKGHRFSMFRPSQQIFFHFHKRFLSGHELSKKVWPWKVNVSRSNEHGRICPKKSDTFILWSLNRLLNRLVLGTCDVWEISIYYLALRSRSGQKVRVKVKSEWLTPCPNPLRQVSIHFSIDWSSELVIRGRSQSITNTLLIRMDHYF